MAKSTQEKKDESNFEKFSDVINAILSANVSMHHEIKQTKQEVEQIVQIFENNMQNWNKKIETIEDYRKKQLIDSQDIVTKINTYETEGTVISDKTILAHLLSSLSLISEQQGEFNKRLASVERGITVLDEKTTEAVLHIKVLTELSKSHREESTKTIGRLVKILAVAVATIAAAIGLDRLLALFKFW